MLKQRVPLWSVLLFLGFWAGFAFAGRSAGGSYSLPSGNPVITGTTIQSTWANNTLNDVAAELTNSLDRQGRGGMSAPLQLASGVVAAPGLCFVAEPTSGLYRAGAGDLRMGVAGTSVFRWQLALNTSQVPFTVTGRTTTTDLTVTGTSDTFTATALTAGFFGIHGTGNTTGVGITGTGGATNATGVDGAGGGSTGLGVRGVGGTSGIGVKGEGGTTGAGGTGVWAVGGGTSGVGLIATAGTAATAATPKDAITVTNGYISMNGVTSPLTATATTNRYTTKNITQAWASVGIDNGGVFFVDDSYGMTAPVEINAGSCTTYAIQMTLNASFPNALSGQPAYAAMAGDRVPPPGAGTAKCHAIVTSKASGIVKVQFVDTTTGLLCSKCGVGTSVNSSGFDITILGAY